MKFPISILCFVALLFVQCASNEDAVNLEIIPLPDLVETNNKYSSITKVYFPGNRLSLYHPWLKTEEFIIREAESPNVSIKIDTSLAPRSYILDIRDTDISVAMHEKSDLRNVLVTILQIAKLNNNRLVQCHIEDTAEFDYRGMHLDVARHFFDVSEVKKYIDYLTFYKFNTFHWHLTEDQGWRIEIKKYPKLQEIAAYRDETLIGHYNDQPHKFDGKRYGGYYTQKEVKEVVAYAQNRGITIIPEIEMPGHAQAALAAYPELGCEDKEYKVATKWGVFNDVYCPTEETFTFLENVMDEVISLFPSEYIHIGGDECPKDAWKKSAYAQNLMKKEGLKDEYELQSYFIGRMSDYLKTKGKTIIGWDEILEGGLNEGSVVMSWRGESGGIKAAKAGHEVIMTPGSHCYFDHYQSTHPDEPLAIGGMTSVEDVYNYDVIPTELTKAEGKFVKGAQGNVWTEYMKEFSQVEYMALARMISLSEVLFNNKDVRNLEAFRRRLAVHTAFWKSKGVNIADNSNEISVKVNTKLNEGVFAIPTSKTPNTKISYTTPAGKTSVLRSDELKLDKPGEYSFYVSKQENPRISRVKFQPHKGNKATIELIYPPSPNYPGSGNSALINGVLGSNEKYGGDEWMGFSGTDFEAKIQFNENIDVQGIDLRFFKGEGQWIYLPKEIQILSSTDDKTYILVERRGNITTDSKVANVSLPLKLNTKHLKVIAKNHGMIGEGLQGAGHKAWLFVDEILIK